MPTTNLGLSIIEESDMVSPDPINENMQAIDEKLGVDYVRERNHTKVVYESGAGMYLGTAVINMGGGTRQVFMNESTFRSKTGHSYTWGRDVVFAINGDCNANNVQVSISYQPNNKTVYCNTSKAVTGTVRCDYAIFWTY